MLDTCWAVVELAESGDSETDTQKITECLRARVPDLEVFFPSFEYRYGGRRIKVSFLPGYLFVRVPGKDGALVFGVESSPFVRSVLSTGEGDSRKSQTVSDKEIRRLREEFDRDLRGKLAVNSPVLICQGDLEGKEGEIVSVDADIASVYVTQGDFVRVEEVPMYFLEPLSQAKATLVSDPISSSHAISLLVSTGLKPKTARSMLYHGACDDTSRGYRDKATNSWVFSSLWVQTLVDRRNRKLSKAGNE